MISNMGSFWIEPIRTCEQACRKILRKMFDQLLMKIYLQNPHGIYIYIYLITYR